MGSDFGEKMKFLAKNAAHSGRPSKKHPDNKLKIRIAPNDKKRRAVGRE